MARLPALLLPVLMLAAAPALAQGEIPAGVETFHQAVHGAWEVHCNRKPGDQVFCNALQGTPRGPNPALVVMVQHGRGQDIVLFLAPGQLERGTALQLRVDEGEPLAAQIEDESVKKLGEADAIPLGPEDSRRFIEEFKKGSRLQVKFTPKGGKEVMGAFSLIGFTAAMGDMQARARAS